MNLLPIDFFLKKLRGIVRREFASGTLLHLRASIAVLECKVVLTSRSPAARSLWAQLNAMGLDARATSRRFPCLVRAQFLQCCATPHGQRVRCRWRRRAGWRRGSTTTTAQLCHAKRGEAPYRSCHQPLSDVPADMVHPPLTFCVRLEPLSCARTSEIDNVLSSGQVRQWLQRAAAPSLRQQHPVACGAQRAEED